MKGERRYSELQIFFSSERERDLSLDLRTIQPSEFVRARSKVIIRSEGFTWVQDLRSFDKLREVGVSSYSIFTLFLSAI